MATEFQDTARRALHGPRSDGIEKEFMKANVIIFSYNRPRMLREAIESVLNQSYQNFDIYIMDDGSDFNVWDIVDEFKDTRILVARIPPYSIEERISVNNTRFPDNLNFILQQIPPEDFIVYLCDDDILAPDWLWYAAEGFRYWPNSHIMQGKCYYFYDGQDPFKDGKEGFQSAFVEERSWDQGVFWWNCGSFALRNICHTNGKCEVFWEPGEEEPHSWDIKYINRILKAHGMIMGVPFPAVYRREHTTNLSIKLGRLTEGKRYGHPTKKLETEMVSGRME